MGYETQFKGKFKLDRPLTEEHKEFLNRFCYTRRMGRDVAKLNEVGTHSKVGLDLGENGAYFVDGAGHHGQDHDDSIIDFNKPPKELACGPSQPGLWCYWKPNEDGTALVWAGMEKFYNYKEWLQYIVRNFLTEWMYVLNGEVKWTGEDQGDVGTLGVRDNYVYTKLPTY